MVDIRPTPATAAPWSQRKRWLDVWRHVAVVTFIGALHVVTNNPVITLQVGGLACLALYVILGISEARRAPLALSPLNFYFFWHAVTLGISAIWAGIQIRERGSLSFSVVQVPGDEVVRGYVYYLIGSVALHIGIQCLRPLPQRTLKRHSSVTGVRTIALLWVVGIMANVATALVAVLGAPGRILQWGALASVTTLAITDRRRLKLPFWSWATLLGVGTLGLLIVNMTTLSKAYVMFAFLPLLWFIYLQPKRRRWLGVAVVAYGVLYLLIVAPVVMRARYIPSTEGSPQARLGQAFARWWAAEPVPSESVGEQTDAFLSRQFDPIAVGFLVGEVERTGYLKGETMQYGVYAFVPRFLWRDKPSMSRGGWFAHYIGQVESDQSTMSLGITATGELFWNFGIIGIVAGMLFIGLLLGGLWNLAGADPRGDLFRMLLYVNVTLTMPNMAEAVTVVSTVVATYLVFKFGMAGVNAMRRRSLLPAQPRLLSS